MNDFATDSLSPDLNILLDLTVSESQKRRQNRIDQSGVQEDRIESEAAAFHERVRQGFLKQSVAAPAKWLVLDASQTPEKLFEILLTELKARKWLA